MWKARSGLGKSVLLPEFFILPPQRACDYTGSQVNTTSHQFEMNPNKKRKLSGSITGGIE